MRILLDTHTFLWFAVQPDLLSKTARTILKDSENDFFLSSISAWEIEQKCQIGKLPLPQAPAAIIEEFRNIYDFLPLAFDETAAFQLHKLPNIHNDPFDRMLICQAIQHSLGILTNDRFITQYPVKTLW